MFEAIAVITRPCQSSMGGKAVKHQGRFFTLETTRLWTMPETPPPVLVATAGPVSAERAGRPTDGLVTVGPQVLQLHLSGAETDGQAVRNAMTADIPDVHRAHIQNVVDLGLARAYLHGVGRNQAEWIEVFGRDALPRLHR